MNNTERTAAFVAMQRRIGGVGKRRKVPRARLPTLIEADYAEQLVAIVDRWKLRLEKLVAELPAMLETVRREHHDDDRARELDTRLGLLIVIENPVGSVRHWTDSDGTEGQTTMKHAYGFIDGVRGADGEDIDVYLGPTEDPDWVFIVHQNSKASGFVDYDEDKVMLGWDTADAARAAYLEQYNDPRFFGGMTVMSREGFLDALEKVDGEPITHGARFDVGEARRTRILLDKARDEVAASAAAVEPAALRYGQQVAQLGKRELAKQVQAGLGLAIPVADLNLNGKLEQFAHENVGLIKSLAASYLGGVEKAILQAYSRGDRWETLQQKLEERHGIAQHHARLIARDQIVTLNAQITRSRHKELGIARFRWLTMRDQRVRPRHKPMEGKVFTYAGDGRPSFFPGEEVLCRCQEEPLFEDIEAEIARILTPPAPAPEEGAAYQAERDRQAAASRAARQVAAHDLAAFAEHQQLVAAQMAAKQAAAELAAKQAAAELAAKQAAEALAAKKSEAAKKAAATRAANKAKREAEKVAAATAAAAQPGGAIRYAAFAPSDFVGFHGRGFVQDADAIEGGSVRVVKVRGTDGKEYFEAVFKVTAPYGDRARAFGTESRSDWAFRQRVLRNGELHDQAQTQSMPNGARVRTVGGNVVEVGERGALRNQVRVRAKSLADLDTMMADFSKHMGVDVTKEPSRADLELQAKARLAAKFDPKAFGSLMTGATSPEEQRAAIEHVFDAQAKKHPWLADALKDARVEEVYPGHKTLYSESLGKRMAKQWGAMYHDGNPPADIAAKIVGDTGLMSSVKRYSSGVFTTGMSTSRDFETGGADGVFMRVSKGTPSSTDGRFRAVIDTEKVMGRMDWWAFDFDNYGRAGYADYQRRWSASDQLGASSPGGGNEVMATHGVPPSAFKKFIVEGESYRQQVLSELRRMGVTEINGKPAEEFVTLR